MLQQFTSYLDPLPDLNTFFSSMAFPIVWGRRNGIEYNYSTLSCPVRPTHLTPHFPYLFYTSLSTWCSVFLSVSFPLPVHLTVGLFFVYALLLTYPYRSSIFSVMFLRHWCYFYGSSHTFVSDFIFLHDHTHLSQHPNLIHLQSRSLICSLLTFLYIFLV